MLLNHGMMDISKKCDGFTYLKNIDCFTKDIKPQLIKKLLYKEHPCFKTDSFELLGRIPVEKLDPRDIPNIESTLLAHPNTDITKCFTAFGRLAIPKLRKLLLHHDLLTSRQAIVTLLDLVHDPEKATECIRLNVLARLVRLMLSEDVYIRQHTLCLLRVIASQPEGPAAIGEKKYIIKNLKTSLLDPDNMVRLQAAMTCMYLGRSWPSYRCLVNACYVDRLLAAICTESTITVLVVLLNALENILEKSDIARQQTIEHSICDLLVHNIQHKCSKVRAATIGVFAQVFVTKDGKTAGERCHVDLIQLLTDCLEDTDEEVIQQAATALGFLFVTTPCKVQGNIKTLEKLIPLALCNSNIGIAMSATQAITNLASYPVVKDQLKENFLERIQFIDTQNDPVLNKCKNRLIKVLTHEV